MSLLLLWGFESVFKGIGKKITLAFITVTITVFGAGFFIWTKIEAVQASNHQAAKKIQAATNAAAAIQNPIFEEIRVIERFHRGGVDQTAHALSGARREIDQAFQTLQESSLLLATEFDSLSTMRLRFHSLMQTMFEISTALEKALEKKNLKEIGRLSRSHQEIMISLDVLRRQMEEILLRIQLRASELSVQNQKENNNALHEVKLSMALLAILAIFVTVIVWFMTERLVSRPLQRLTEEVQSIGTDNLDRRIHIQSNDEIRILEASFNRMMNNLQKNIRKRQEDEMELMREHKLAGIGQLAQGIAHNLNNPLGVVLLVSQAIAKKYPLSTEAELIESSAQKMKTIIGTLLSKSRQEQVQGKQQIDLNKLISEEFRFLEADLDFKHKIEKEIRLADNLPLVVGVYSDFSQSFSNILRNAIDAMYRSSAKHLAVQSRFDEEDIYIDVSDTGCGIPKESIPKLFDPFFTTKPLKGTEQDGEPTGTGLGLSSCYQLLHPYSATIEVKSKLGEGSTFTIKIPYRIP